MISYTNYKYRVSFIGFSLYLSVKIISILPTCLLISTSQDFKTIGKLNEKIAK